MKKNTTNKTKRQHTQATQAVVRYRPKDWDGRSQCGKHILGDLTQLKVVNCSCARTSGYIDRWKY